MLPACLVLAPHLQYPTRNGADILIDRRYRALSQYFSFVDIVGESRIVRYKTGKLVSDWKFGGTMRSRWLAAARTVVRDSHYYAERYVTPKFLKIATPFWADPVYKVVIFSQLGVASAFAVLEKSCPVSQRLHVVETHNNDYAWFQNLIDASKNPLLRLAASSSLRWVDRFLGENASEFLFIHVSEQDRAGYESKHPRMRSLVFSPGTELHSPPRDPVRDGKIRLLFVGSLGVKMNLDALVYFQGYFYPALLDRFGDQLHITVAGNNPSRQVKALCTTMKWPLLANISDDGLRSAYESALFSLLPFPYTSGVKLKMLDTLSYGVPFLATTHVTHQVKDPEALFPCLFSDDRAQWVRRVEQIQETGDSTFRRMLSAFAEQYTWERLAEKHMQLLEREISTALK